MWVTIWYLTVNYFPWPTDERIDMRQSQSCMQLKQLQKTKMGFKLITSVILVQFLSKMLNKQEIS